MVDFICVLRKEKHRRLEREFNVCWACVWSRRPGSGDVNPEQDCGVHEHPSGCDMHDKFSSYQGCVSSDGGRKVTENPAGVSGEER